MARDWMQRASPKIAKMRNPFEEFPVFCRSDGCRHETGYSAKLLQDLFMIYSTDLFVELDFFT